MGKLLWFYNQGHGLQWKTTLPIIKDADMNKKLRKNKKWLIEDGLIGKKNKTKQPKTKQKAPGETLCAFHKVAVYS